MTVGLQGLKGELVRVEANVRVDKEQCVIMIAQSKGYFLWPIIKPLQ